MLPTPPHAWAGAAEPRGREGGGSGRGGEGEGRGRARARPGELCWLPRRCSRCRAWCPAVHKAWAVAHLGLEPAGLADLTRSWSPADVDECADAGACGEARCQNLPGSYSCLCDEGYAFHAQEKACRGTAPPCVHALQLGTFPTLQRRGGGPAVYAAGFCPRCHLLH